MKYCSKCKQEKPIELFGNNKSTKDGFCSWCKACNKQYYLQNKDEILAKTRAYRNNNRNKIREQSRKYHHSKNGLIVIIYKSQINSSKDRGHHPPLYTRAQLYKWCISQKKFHSLFEQWEKSDYDKSLTPSVDRKDDDKGYSFDNIQLMTWKENNNKACLSFGNKRTIPVIATNIITGIEQEYVSAAVAGKKLGIDKSQIGGCCLNKPKYKTAKGYRFRFKE